MSEGTRPEAGAAPGPVDDPRVAAVLEVLAGQPLEAVAVRWEIDAVLLDRWVTAFVDAGSGAVTNRPDPTAASQRDRFLAAFAHELRTPLAIARGWADVLAREVRTPEAREAVGMLKDSLVRLADRTRDVEMLAAASLGRLRVHHAEVTVADVVAILDDVGEIGGLGAGHPMYVDPALLGIVLRDLWAAVRRPPTPRHVQLHVRDVGPWTELRIVRQGSPVPARVLQAMFEPFDLNDDATGVTIGLYLARALAVAHGGQLGADQDDDRVELWLRVPTHGNAPRPVPPQVDDDRPGEATR